MCEEEKKETTEKCSKKDEINDIVKIIYEKLFSEVRELERNYLTLIVGLISALGIYFYGLKECSTLVQNSHKFEGIIVFGFSFIASIFISCVIIFVSNIFGYTHRCNQLILSKIEQKNCLYTSNILPNKWNLYNHVINENQPADLPEIYKLFKRIGLLLIVFELVFSIFIMFKYQLIEEFLKEKWIFVIFVISITIPIVCLIILPTFYTLSKLNSLKNFNFTEFAWTKYEDDLKNLFKNQKNQRKEK